MYVDSMPLEGIVRLSHFPSYLLSISCDDPGGEENEISCESGNPDNQSQSFGASMKTLYGFIEVDMAASGVFL